MVPCHALYPCVIPLNVSRRCGAKSGLKCATCGKPQGSVLPNSGPSELLLARMLQQQWGRMKREPAWRATQARCEICGLGRVLAGRQDELNRDFPSLFESHRKDGGMTAFRETPQGCPVPFMRMCSPRARIGILDPDFKDRFSLPATAGDAERFPGSNPNGHAKNLPE